MYFWETIFFFSADYLDFWRKQLACNLRLVNGRMRKSGNFIVLGNMKMDEKSELLPSERLYCKVARKHIGKHVDQRQLRIWINPVGFEAIDNLRSILRENKPLERRGRKAKRRSTRFVQLSNSVSLNYVYFT